MLKDLIKSLDNNPLNPRILAPFLPTNPQVWSRHNEA